MPRRQHAPSRRRGGLSAVISAALLVMAAPALAEAPPSDAALADKAFLEGKKAILDHRLGEACAKFAESQRLDPQPGTLLYLATCHAEQGKTATAWGEYKDAEALAVRRGKSERAKDARARTADIEGRLSRVQIRVDAPAPGLVVRANGLEIRDVGAALPFDPGPLTFEASAPGRVPWVKTVAVPPGPSVQEVVVPALAPLPTAAPPPPARPPVSDAHLAAERRTRWIAAGAVGGVGVVGVVIGGVFGALASHQYKDALKAGKCDDTTCADHARFSPGYADALRSSYISTASLIAGGAALVTGVILAVTIPSDHAEVRLGAGLGPAITLEGRF